MPKTRKSSLPGVHHMSGHFSARGKKIGIVVSEFNEFLTSRLLEGALDTLVRHGANPKNITVVHVPGAFEIPLTVKKMIRKIKPDAVITLSVVIRGQTRHFDQVVREAARGIGELAQKSEVPIILGMIPAQTIQQAFRRVGVKEMNKGREWALSAIAMANLTHDLSVKGKR